MKGGFGQIDRFLGPDLKTYDPYDVWKTRLGLRLKKFYYEKGRVSAPIVAPFYLLDLYAPRLLRLFVKPQEFPIVRAFAVLTSLNYYEITAEKKYLDCAAGSVEWLIANRLPGYRGACWGLNMPWMTKSGYSPPSTPFISNTPYCVEALFKYSSISNDEKSHDIAFTSLEYLENDLHRLIDVPQELAVSYGPTHERRIVINGNAYAMMLYALFASKLSERQDSLTGKAVRIYNFIKSCQNSDGSWLYYSDDGKGNFIDCFHTCFVLKNLIKFGKYINKDVSEVVNLGLEYLMENFLDERYCLARKFSISANPSLIKFDLYDQAELLNLLLMAERLQSAEKLYTAIMEYFYISSKGTFGNQIDIFNLLHKRNYLRWPLMPMIYAQSKYFKAFGIKG